jgi:hypothetical protein
MLLRVGVGLPFIERSFRTLDACLQTLLSSNGYSWVAMSAIPMSGVTSVLFCLSSGVVVGVVVEVLLLLFELDDGVGVVGVRLFV